MLDLDARLVEDRRARGHALDERQAGQACSPGVRHHLRALIIDQFGIGDQLCQHHRDRLQSLDLDLFIFARIAMLHADHAHRTLGPDDRHAGEAVEFLLAGFGHVEEVRMRRRLGQVQRVVILGDRADQAFSAGETGDVNRFGVEAARRIKLQRTFAQQIDRADFAIQRLADDIDDMVQLALRMSAAGHHFVEAGQDLSGGDGGGLRHATGLSACGVSREFGYGVVALFSRCQRCGFPGEDSAGCARERWPGAAAPALCGFIQVDQWARATLISSLRASFCFLRA